MFVEQSRIREIVLSHSKNASQERALLEEQNTSTYLVNTLLREENFFLSRTVDPTGIPFCSYSTNDTFFDPSQFKNFEKVKTLDDLGKSVFDNPAKKYGVYSMEAMHYTREKDHIHKAMQYVELLYREMKNHDGSFKKKKVLDLACGPGTILRIANVIHPDLYQWVIQEDLYHGVDMSRMFIREARFAHQGVNFHCMRIDQFFSLFKSIKADIAIFAGSLGTIPRLFDPLDIVNDIYKRGVKPGGKLFLDLNTGDTRYNAWDIGARHRDLKKSGIPYNLVIDPEDTATMYIALKKPETLLSNYLKKDLKKDEKEELRNKSIFLREAMDQLFFSGVRNVLQLYTKHEKKYGIPHFYLGENDLKTQDIYTFINDANRKINRENETQGYDLIILPELSEIDDSIVKIAKASHNAPITLVYFQKKYLIPGHTYKDTVERIFETITNLTKGYSQYSTEETWNGFYWGVITKADITLDLINEKETVTAAEAIRNRAGISGVQILYEYGPS